jgi:hypothetical protein
LAAFDPATSVEANPVATAPGSDTGEAPFVQSRLEAGIARRLSFFNSDCWELLYDLLDEGHEVANVTLGRVE